MVTVPSTAVPTETADPRATARRVTVPRETRPAAATVPSMAVPAATASPRVSPASPSSTAVPVPTGTVLLPPQSLLQSLLQNRLLPQPLRLLPNRWRKSALSAA